MIACTRCVKYRKKSRDAQEGNVAVRRPLARALLAANAPENPAKNEENLGSGSRVKRDRYRVNLAAKAQGRPASVHSPRIRTSAERSVTENRESNASGGHAPRTVGVLAKDVSPAEHAALPKIKSPVRSVVQRVHAVLVMNVSPVKKAALPGKDCPARNESPGALAALPMSESQPKNGSLPKGASLPRSAGRDVKVSHCAIRNSAPAAQLERCGRATLMLHVLPGSGRPKNVRRGVEDSCICG